MKGLYQLTNWYKDWGQTNLTMTNPKRSLVWWLVLGWWWRPIKYILFMMLSSLLGFRKLRISRY